MYENHNEQVKLYEDWREKQYVEDCASKGLSVSLLIMSHPSATLECKR